MPANISKSCTDRRKASLWQCVCVRVYIYVFMWACMCVCIHIYVHVCVWQVTTWSHWIRVRLSGFQTMSWAHVQSTIVLYCPVQVPISVQVPNPNFDGSMLLRVPSCDCTLFEITKSQCIVSSKSSGQISEHLCWYGCIAHICNINCSNAQQHSALSHIPLPTFIFFFHSHKQ